MVARGSNERRNKWRRDKSTPQGSRVRGEFHTFEGAHLNILVLKLVYIWMTRTMPGLPIPWFFASTTIKLTCKSETKRLNPSVSSVWWGMIAKPTSAHVNTSWVTWTDPYCQITILYKPIQCYVLKFCKTAYAVSGLFLIKLHSPIFFDEFNNRLK